MLNLSMCAAKQQEVAKESRWYDLYWQGPQTTLQLYNINKNENIQELR